MEKENFKQLALTNFKKAQSHINNLIKMTEQNVYCVEIMQQNLAVLGLLKSAHQLLMENHLNSCFKKAMESKNEKRKQEMIEEILKVMKFNNK